MSNKPLRILVVDDDKNFAHTLCAILSTQGYICQEVNSVDAAQTVLINEKIDCVLSDVKMPNQTGTDFYYRIKDQFPNMPFILMTAYTSMEVIDKVMQSGVLATFQKPINIHEILRFFARLSQNLQVAIVSKQEDAGEIIKEILENKRFTYTIYPSIEALIDSLNIDFAIVFINSEEYCSHHPEKIYGLFDYLPERTIVVICDYKTTIDSNREKPEKVNLIILPREDRLLLNISKILQKEFFDYAKEII